MSFAFNWHEFAREEKFQTRVISLLTDALNKKKPPIIEDKITVQELDWGGEAPSMEILEVGDLASDRLRAIFKVNYSGSARITLATKVQANLLHVYQSAAPSYTLPEFVGAESSFTIPLNLTLSDFVISGIVILVFSKAKGLTLVFRNDPLQGVRVSSSFNHLPAIATFLQSQIENHIRSLLREEVPSILYTLSLQWSPNQFERQLVQQQPISHVKPVRFVDIDEEKRFSLANALRLEAMSLARRTLAVSPQPIPTAMFRAELRHRQRPTSQQPVKLLGPEMFDHVHTQAVYIASRASHKPRRRVIHLRHRKNDQQHTAELPAVTTPPVRATSAPPLIPDGVFCPSASSQAPNVSAIANPVLLVEQRSTTAMNKRPQQNHHLVVTPTELAASLSACMSSLYSKEKPFTEKKHKFLDGVDDVSMPDDSPPPAYVA